MKTAALMAAVAIGVALCGWAGPKKTVVAWSEGTAPKNVYPNDINGAIAEGLKASEALKDWDVVVANDERYSDPYVVPPTDDVPFTGVHVHKDGAKEPCKLGYCWNVGKARYFYFQLGHETNPIYFQPEIRTIMANAVLWAAKK